MLFGWDLGAGNLKILRPSISAHSGWVSIQIKVFVLRYFVISSQKTFALLREERVSGLILSPALDSVVIPYL